MFIKGRHSTSASITMFKWVYGGYIMLQLRTVIGLGVFHSSKEHIQIPVPTVEHSSDHHLESVCCRRQMIDKSCVSLLGAITVSNYPGIALAENDNDAGILEPQSRKKAPTKPFAPTAALLPASRVKSTIDESILLIEEYSSLEEGLQSKDRRDGIINLLVKMICVKSFMTPISGTSSPNSMAKPIDERLMKPSKAKLYQETYNDKLKGISPIDVPYALLTKTGDYRQFDQLQKRQRKLEKLNGIREAFNYYTRQLQFDTEYYVLNASAEDKKRMIRNDALPDIKSVIVSDLDMRDLVRNQVLDAYDDVKFELQYQVKNYESGADFDWYEMKTVLSRARSECDRWFSFIAIDDVEKAIEIVSQEL